MNPDLVLGGSGWSCGPLVATEARVVYRAHAPFDATDFYAFLDREVARRRSARSGASTGLAVALAYDALGPLPSRRDPDGHPKVLAIAVDASCPYRPRGTVRAPARAEGAARTSLSRPAYGRAFAAVVEHIHAGDIYQGNLCRQLRVPVAGDPFAAWERLVHAAPAPHASFLATEDGAIASASPERFVSVDPGGRIETRPIKGTRPRGSDPERDRALARELTESEKDRAELLMIVDLERNDLSRVCEPGTVRTPCLAELVSFPAVHHLVATVEGDLVPGTSPADIVRAVFPGGSITGAPKRRAVELLDAYEPVGRNWFTGSLFWFGDDGSVDSSILIRTCVFREAVACLGAGGGIVADSDCESEWRETCHKARVWTEALGFAPEEAR